LVELPTHQIQHIGQPEQDEAELACLGEQQGNVHGFGMRTSRNPAQCPEKRRFEQQQAANQPHHQKSLSTEKTKIDGHAHTHKKQSEQQTTERLDVGHDLMAVAGISQKEAAKKCTKGHRQPGPICEPCGTEHYQYSGSCKYLGIAPASGNELQYRTQEDAPQDEDSDNDHHRFQRCQFHILGDGQLLLCKQWQQCHQRYNGQILEKQDGKGRSAVARAEFTLVAEYL